MRRGLETGPALLVAIALLLIVAGLYVVWIYRTDMSVSTILYCQRSGGFCSPNKACETGYVRAYWGALGCDEGNICCKPWGATATTSTDKMAAGGTCDGPSKCISGVCENGKCVGGTTPQKYTIPTIQPATLQIINTLSKQQVTSERSLVYAHTNNLDRYTVRGTFEFPEFCNDPKTPELQKIMDDNVKKFGCNWNIRFVLSNARNDPIVTQELSLFEGLGQQPARDMLNIKISNPSPPKVMSDKTEVQFSYAFEPIFDAGQAGQQYHLVVTLYPEGNTPLEKRADVSFGVVSNVAYSGLSTVLTQKKEIQVQCKDTLKCSETFVEIQSAKSSCEPKFLNSDMVLPTPKTKWIMYRDGISIAEYDTSDACVNSKPQTSNPVFVNAFNAFSANYDAGKNVEAEIKQLMAMPMSPEYVCNPETKSIEAGTFRITNFNIQTQRGLFTIDNKDLAGYHMCIYGKEAGKVYSAGPSQQIMIDRTPPRVTAKFDSLHLITVVSCTDESGKAQFDSGCKQNIGIAYITNIDGYLKALSTGRNQASIYCPQQKSAYITDARREIPYTSNEIRVLCVRAEDNADNAAVTAVTVFNAYDLIAKSLMLAAQQ